MPTRRPRQETSATIKILFTAKKAGIIKQRGDNMVGFILGSMFGGAVGVFAMCLCVAAKWGDEFTDR